MSVDVVRLQELFGAESVTAWEPPTPAAIGSVAEGTPMVSPTAVDEACEVLRFAASADLRVLPAGSGEHLHLGAAPGAIDLVLSSRRMRRILEHEPEDLTLVAQAGVTLHQI
ncbi:MAG: FAD-binding oxidoreductase, partial [Candidatus Krumholzibacteriia bacterium]